MLANKKSDYDDHTNLDRQQPLRQNFKIIIFSMDKSCFVLEKFNFLHFKTFH